MSLSAEEGKQTAPPPTQHDVMMRFFLGNRKELQLDKKLS